MIQIFINNSKYNFDKNLTILQALEKLNIEVPKFCYNDRLSVAGNCRMCLVEVEKSPKPVVSCATPITEGVSIFTDTPLVKKARESVLEFLLVNHPLDCPICDQGGECDLQDQTKGFGSDRNRSFKYNKRGVQDKDVGPIIKTIMTRCIHCTRCVRFVTEITGKASLGTFGRGRSTEIGTYINDFIKTELSGNLVDLCPVGALTSKPYAFMARSWELKKTETIDLFDAIGSNIVAGARNVSKSETLKMQSYENSREKIMRILPKFNEDINEAWISDKSRYAFDGIYVHRTLEPLFINNSFNKIHSNTNWNFILNKISSDISNNVIFGIINKDFNKINNIKLEYQNLKKVSSKFDLIWSNNFKTDFISKKMYSQFILNKFYKTKLIKGHVENIDTLDSTLNFVYFLKTIGVNAISTTSYNKTSNNDIAYYFTFNTSFKNIEKSKIIILIDINPRKEASVFNIRLSKYLSKNNVTLYNFGIASDLYYKYNHKGSSLKNFINFLEGRDLLCVKSRNVNQISIICGTEYLARTSGDSLQNAIKTLNAKLYLNSKVTKGFNLLSSSINNLYDYELNISNSYKYNFATKNADLFLIKGHSFKENNKLLKSKEIIYYATHNNEYIQKGLTSVVLPVTTHFEKNGIVLNVEGLLQKNYKVINAPSNIIKNTEDINESILILNSLKKSYLNNNLTSYELFIKNNNKMLNYYYNSKLLNQFYYKLKFYKNYEFKRIYLGSFKEKIHNFYMSDIISKNSSVMSMCTLFNVQKNNYQLLIN